MLDIRPFVLDVIHFPVFPDPRMVKSYNGESFGSDNGRPFRCVMNLKGDHPSE